MVDFKLLQCLLLCKNFFSPQICIYITYTMLPIRGIEAIVGGSLISTSHITLLIYLHKMNTLNMVTQADL